MNESDPRVLGRGLLIWWWIAIAASTPLFIRTLWEETLLTWREGPQMIGFTIAHVHPEILLLGVLGYLATLAWLVTAVVLFLKRRKRPSGVQLAYLAIAVGGFAVSLVPYRFWASLGGVKVAT